MVHNVARW